MVHPIVKLLRRVSVRLGCAAWACVLGAGSALAASAADNEIAPPSGRQVFLQVCAACHVTGVAGAPRIGVLADWHGRVGKGQRGLLGAVLRGKDGMPPKGGNASVSDHDAAAALDFMLFQLTDRKAVGNR